MIVQIVTFFKKVCVPLWIIKGTNKAENDKTQNFITIEELYKQSDAVKLYNLLNVFYGVICFWKVNGVHYKNGGNVSEVQDARHIELPQY